MVSSAPTPPLHPLLQQHREAILRLACRHGVERVRVFGSFARGEARADSDVDLLIDAGAETPAWFPGGFVAEMQELLGRRVDVAEPGALHPRLRDRIIAEAVAL